MTEQMEQGDTVACDNCLRARPIENPVIELFGARIGFGPAGETDMFVERDGEVTCYWCLDDPDRYVDSEDSDVE